MSDPTNRNKLWICPYWKWDGVRTIHCEGGSLQFPTRECADAYMLAYCGANPEWQRCSVARALNEYYEKIEEAKDEKRRQTARRRESDRRA